MFNEKKYLSDISLHDTAIQLFKYIINIFSFLTFPVFIYGSCLVFRIALIFCSHAHGILIFLFPAGNKNLSILFTFHSQVIHNRVPCLYLPRLRIPGGSETDSPLLFFYFVFFLCFLNGFRPSFHVDILLKIPAPFFPSFVFFALPVFSCGSISATCGSFPSIIHRISSPPLSDKFF